MGTCFGSHLATSSTMAANNSNVASFASGRMRAHALRLRPGVDLVPGLLEGAEKAMTEAKSKSAFVLTAVGSLTEVTLRMAHAGTSGQQNLNEIKTLTGPFEILSLVGTFAADKSKHLHMTVSDSTGAAFGGHVVDGKIFTTLELVLGTVDDVSFDRMHDERTGYRELVVSPGNN